MIRDPRLARVVERASDVVPALLAIAASGGTLRFGLVGDAEFLIRDNAFMRAWRYLPQQLTHDYFWASSGEGIGYWRPVTKASWLVETMLGGGSAAVYHAVQIALFMLAVVGVQRLLLDAGVGRLAATVAAAVLALHPATIEPVALVMARSDVGALAGTVWALQAWRRWALPSNSITTKRGWLALHLAALVFALGSKEIAVVTVVPLAVWALAERRSWAWRARVLGPPVVVSIAYLVARRAALGPGPAPGLQEKPLAALVAFGTYLVGLFPIRLETGVRNVSFAELADPGRIAWAAFAIVVLAAWAFLARRRPLSLSAIAWVGASLGVVLVVKGIPVPGAAGKLAMADRWLLPAVAGVAVFLASEFSAIASPRVRLAIAASITAWAVASLVVGPIQRAPYLDGLTLLGLEDRALEDTPERFWTTEDRCRLSERRMARATAAGAADTALVAFDALRAASCPTTPEQSFNLLAVLVRAERWQRALGVVVATQDHPPSGRQAGPFRHLVGLTLLRSGQPRVARAQLEDAARLGVTDCSVPLAIGEACLRLGDDAGGSVKLEEGWSCLRAQGRASPDTLKLAAEAATRAGDPERAARLTRLSDTH